MKDVLWFENSKIKRSKRQGQQGDYVSPKNSTDFVPCPKCFQQNVVYNGNYFCDNFGMTCDWALPHPARKNRDKNFCDLLGLDYF